MVGRQVSARRSRDELGRELDGIGIEAASLLLSSADAFPRALRAAQGFVRGLERHVQLAGLEDVEEAAADAQRWAASRAELTAATESSEAWTMARDQALQDLVSQQPALRYELWKVWDAELDKGTCGTCAEAHGTIVRIDEDFPAGHPGGVHPKCRCSYHVITRQELHRESRRSRVSVPEQVGPAPKISPEDKAAQAAAKKEAAAAKRQASAAAKKASRAEQKAFADIAAKQKAELLARRTARDAAEAAAPGPSAAARVWAAQAHRELSSADPSSARATLRHVLDRTGGLSASGRRVEYTASDALRIDPALSTSGLHDWDGSITFKREMFDEAKDGLAAVARGERTSLRQSEAISSLLHEELHGYGPIGRSTYGGYEVVNGAYVFSGPAALEEVITESAARRISGELLPHVHWSRGQSYSREIGDVARLVAEATGSPLERIVSRNAMGVETVTHRVSRATRDRVTRAAMAVKRNSTPLRSADELVDRFVAGLDLDPSAAKQLAATLKGSRKSWAAGALEDYDFFD